VHHCVLLEFPGKKSIREEEAGSGRPRLEPAQATPAGEVDPLTGVGNVASERCSRRGAPPHPGRTVVDAREFGDLQIERGAEFRQVGCVTSQIIELSALAVMSATGRQSRLRFGRPVPAPEASWRPDAPAPAHAGAPKYASASLGSGRSASCASSKRPELIVEFCPAAELLDEAPGSGQARQAGPSLRLELHPVLPSGNLPQGRLHPHLPPSLRARMLPYIPSSTATRILVGR